MYKQKDIASTFSVLATTTSSPIGQFYFHMARVPSVKNQRNVITTCLSLGIDQTVALVVSCLSSGIAICFNIAKVTDVHALEERRRRRPPNTSRSFPGECNDADDVPNVLACPNMIAPDAALYTLHRSKFACPALFCSRRSMRHSFNRPSNLNCNSSRGHETLSLIDQRM